MNSFVRLFSLRAEVDAIIFELELNPLWVKHQRYLTNVSWVLLKAVEIMQGALALGVGGSEFNS